MPILAYVFFVAYFLIVVIMYFPLSNKKFSHSISKFVNSQFFEIISPSLSCMYMVSGKKISFLIEFLVFFQKPCTFLVLKTSICYSRIFSN